MLQTFADESFGKKYTVLSGYLGYEEEWERFADVWQTVLDRKPKLKYLKVKEALSFPLTGEFRGFSEAERDLRLAAFIEIIKKFALAAIIVPV